MKIWKNWHKCYFSGLGPLSWMNLLFIGFSLIAIFSCFLMCFIFYWCFTGSSQLMTGHLTTVQSYNKLPKRYLQPRSKVPTAKTVSCDRILGARKPAHIHRHLQHPTVTWPWFTFFSKTVFGKKNIPQQTTGSLYNCDVHLTTMNSVNDQDDSCNDCCKQNHTIRLVTWWPNLRLSRLMTIMDRLHYVRKSRTTCNCVCHPELLYVRWMAI